MVAASPVEVIDFEGPDYEPGARPPSPPWHDDWGKGPDETDFTVESGVGFGGSNGLVVRGDRGVFYEFAQPLTPEMGAITVSILFLPDSPPAGWNFGDFGGVQLGYGSKSGGTGQFVGCIFRIVNQNDGIYGPGSMWGTRITGWSAGQWYEITYDVAANWESIDLTVGPVDGEKVSMNFDWNGHEITKIWTARSNTDTAVYDNLSVPLVSETVDGYTAWIEAFDLPEELASPESDAAGDGVSNLIKYALGVDPVDSAADALPVAEVLSLEEMQYPSITLVVRDDDPNLKVEAEASSDMENWDVPMTGIENVPQNNVPDGFRRYSWRTVSPAETEEPVFLRINAVR